MLSPLDETFMHQAPVPFAQTVVSDHRFFDRMWLAGHSKDHCHFLMGMAAYKNTNAFDGYIAVIRNNRQYNLRLARPLLPDPALMAVGPLAVEIVKPLEQLRITISPGEHGISGELVFTSTVPVSLEAPHRSRVNGATVQDYMRFDQLGRVDGWLEVGGERFSVDDWFGARDHSWGVRPGQGGYDPLTSLPEPGTNPHDVGAGQDGFLVVVLWFDMPSLGGYLMKMENGAGETLYSHGRILKRQGGGFHEVETTSIEHDLQFIGDTRTSSGGTITVVTTEGERLAIEVESLVPTICYKGTGYDLGYADEKGPGFHRGDVLEHDVYDLSHVEDVGLPDGRVVRPWHREGGAIVRMNGEEGMAHFPVVSSGHIRRYGLDTPTTNLAAE